jgi:hypothetical protein
VRNAWYLADETPISANYYYLPGSVIFQVPWNRETDKLQKNKKGIDKKTDHSTASIGIIAFLKTLKA